MLEIYPINSKPINRFIFHKKSKGGIANENEKTANSYYNIPFNIYSM